MSNMITKNMTTYDNLYMLSQLSNNLVLSQEGFGSFIEKVGSFFVTKVGQVREALGLSASQSNKLVDEYNAYLKDLDKNKQNLIWVVNNVEYMTAKQLRVMAPAGIKVDLVKLSSLLEEALEDIQDKVFKSLDELDITISSVLSDESYRLQSKPLKPNKDAITYSDKLYDMLNKCIDTKKLEDTRLIKDLLPNISSMTKVYDTLVKSANKTSSKFLININDLIDSIYVKTQTLEKEMNEEFEISKTVLNKLATDLEYNAKLVTATMSVVYLYNQTVLCLNNLVNKLVTLDRK